MTARRRPVAAAARPALAVALATTALVVAGLMAASTRLLLHGCVQADALGAAGLRLAVLRRVADCPDGTLGAGPTALVLLSVALPVLAAYVVLAIGGLGAVAAVARLARLVGRLVLPSVARSDRPTVAVERRPLVLVPLVARPVARVLVGGIARRGPPVAA
ncbi:hypothetical protein [Cellulomonas edaphi]|uniref:Uncharacterized protein n=1 Tax=Cellulomonas edaphi TaxID=3053468 RepID=A0ABT7S4D2_9CELL|nr:hypothetical protein [Cellulomons edaphi]MDM7830486.1 hypothetical protein [Cellulomons edaphi]